MQRCDGAVRFTTQYVFAGMGSLAYFDGLVELNLQLKLMTSYQERLVNLPSTTFKRKFWKMNIN